MIECTNEEELRHYLFNKGICKKFLKKVLKISKKINSDFPHVMVKCELLEESKCCLGFIVEDTKRNKVAGWKDYDFNFRTVDILFDRALRRLYINTNE